MKKIVLTVALGLMMGTQAWAVFGIGDTAIVEDPLNLAKNTLTAAQTLDIYKKQIEQYAQQLQSYVQDAKAFVKVPMSYVDDVTSAFQQYNMLLNQAQGISYTVRNATAQFEQLYSTGWQGNVSLMQRAQAMLGQIRAASASATAVSALFDKLCLDQAKAAQLVAVAQAAPGSLAAEQASVQMLALMAGQQGDLAKLAAVNTRVQTSWIMQETVANETAQQRANEWMQGWPTGGFRGPGQGQGSPLPQ